MTELDYKNGVNEITIFKDMAVKELSKQKGCWEDLKDAEKKRVIHWEVLNNICDYYSKYPELVLNIIRTYKSPKKWTFLDEYDAYTWASCNYSKFGTLYSTRYELSFTPYNSNEKIYFYKVY